jgi:tetratricopeptide (TPR) repeat protein
VLTFALGLLAKPMLVTLPFVLLLLDYWPLGRMNGRFILHPSSFILREKLPLFALALASCVVTFLAQRHGLAVAPLEAFPLAARLGNALLAYASYLGKTLWPMHLAVHYPHPGPAVSVAGAAAAGLLLAVLTALVLGPGRRRPYLAVGWLWFLGTLVPVIGLVQVGSQALADRYTYIPLIGLFLALTWGAADLAAAWRLPRPYLIATAALVLSACGALTWVQVGYWKSSLHLWERAAAVSETDGLAHLNLGDCYRARGMFADAGRAYARAAEFGPGRPEPHAKLATVLADLGRPEQAAAEYRRAIDLDPKAAWLHFNRGSLLVQLGRPEEAIAEFRAAGELDSASAWPHNNLGNLLRDQGRPEEALAEYRRAIDLDPDDALLHSNLGGLLQEVGRLEEALAEYRRALELGDEQAWPRLRACEQLAALRARLPDLVVGRDRPADNAERLAFADLCRRPGERRYALAARLYADAFRADPRLADDLRAAHRFHAAGAAAAAGCGQGQDASGLDEPEKARLRRQALDWLRADLADWAKQARDERSRAAIQQALRNWERSADLAGVRDPATLAKLSAAEAQTWRQLWQEAATVLSRASDAVPPAKK